MKEYKVPEEVLEEYLKAKYREIKENDYHLIPNTISGKPFIHVRERILGLLEFESLIRGGRSAEWIQNTYDELMEEWYKNGKIKGSRVRCKAQEVGVMSAMIIREEMYSDE
jgi:hypothetical protein